MQGIERRRRVLSVLPCWSWLLLLSLHVARVASLQDDNACSTCFSAATLHATNTTSHARQERQEGGWGESEMIDDVAKY